MAEMGDLADEDLARGLAAFRRALVRDRGRVGRLAPADRNRDPDQVGHAEEALFLVPAAPSSVPDCRRNAIRPGPARGRHGLARAVGRSGSRRARPPTANRRGATSMPSPPVEGACSAGASASPLALPAIAAIVLPGLARAAGPPATCRALLTAPTFRPGLDHR